ncbi:hypothetical protein L198_05656 [Cryptococcus wingfieldii CBS 7118]|uniref:Uncharacterized protein n=1 Tax=Cryptococcus wingfieldii CBS 7118 TaxID=1295528 RepID=A0A1E3ITP4_9TREE|nr:hypothetical protein L198_05656 [Cryptococcus wingfieldii CBS 7118]ODN91984.1 hypothetical protein L198_05656 [Cryptococcus wingfieldii CBS 7118]
MVGIVAPDLKNTAGLTWTKARRSGWGGAMGGRLGTVEASEVVSVVVGVVAKAEEEVLGIQGRLLIITKTGCAIIAKDMAILQETASSASEMRDILRARIEEGTSEEEASQEETSEEETSQEETSEEETSEEETVAIVEVVTVKKEEIVERTKTVTVKNKIRATTKA